MAPINIKKIKWQFASKAYCQKLPDTLSSCVWEVVKTNPKRTVYRVGTYFIKVYIFSGFSGHLKKYISNGARKEWFLSKRLFELFKYTPEPAAFGVGFGVSILVTCSVEPCMTAAQFCFTKLDAIGKKKAYKIVDGFAAFITRLYDTGFIQKDFNLGNILVSDDYSRFFVVDLQYAKLKYRALTENEIAKNLSRLLPPFYLIETRYKIRFFLALTFNFPGLRSKMYSVQKQAFHLMRHQWLKKSSRKLKERSKRLNLVSTSVSRGYLKNEIDSQLKNILTKNPELLFSHVIKVLKNDTSLRSSIINLRGEKYLFKRYNTVGFYNRFKSLFCFSFALKIWETEHLLLVREVLIPVLFATIDFKKGLFTKYTYVLQEYIEESITIENLLLKKMITESLLKKILQKLAGLLWIMHQSGICLCGAGAENFLWSENEKPEIIVVDCNNIRFVSKVTDRQKISDLKDISISLMRFEKGAGHVGCFINYYIFLEQDWKSKNKLYFKKIINKVARDRKSS